MNLSKDLLAVFIMALCMRALFLISPHEIGDSERYRTIAVNLIQHHAFSLNKTPPFEPTTLKTPVYPMFIALVYSVFGINDRFVYLFQTIVGALTCVVAYLISMDLFDNRKVALWGGIACALHPFLSCTVGTVMEENLFTFMFAITMLCLVRAVKFKSTALYFLSGILLGATALTKPVASLFIVFVLGAVLFFSPALENGRKRVITCGTVLILGFMLCLSPWALRNYLATKHVIWIVSGARVMSLYLASLDEDVFDNVRSDSYHELEEKDPLYKEWFLNCNGPMTYAIEQKMWKKAIERIRDHPFSYGKNRLKNLPFLWIGSTYLIKTPWSMLAEKRVFRISALKSAILVLFHILPIALYLAAGWILRKSWRDYIIIAYMVPLYITMLFVPIHAEMRYSLVAYPYVLIFCAYVLAAKRDTLRREL